MGWEGMGGEGWDGTGRMGLDWIGWMDGWDGVDGMGCDVMGLDGWMRWAGMRWDEPGSCNFGDPCLRRKLYVHIYNVREKFYVAKKHLGDQRDAPAVPGTDAGGGPAKVVAGYLEWFKFVDELAKAVREHVVSNRRRDRPLLERSCANVAFCCISGGAGCESGN